MKSTVKNVYFRWYRYDYFGGRKTMHWFGLSVEDGIYYKHFYQNSGTMKQQIAEKEFKEAYDLYIKDERYNFEIKDI